MLAAFAAEAHEGDPLASLRVGEVPEPTPPDGWVKVKVRAATLNQHDVWLLRGAVAVELDRPLVLGLDAAGLTEDGREVVVHAVLTQGQPVGGDETLDATRTVLADAGHGTFAEYVTVPERNLVRMPAGFSWAEAASLPTAWLTAYRMLFTRARAQPGETVLIQGASGSVAIAAIVLARAAGLTVVVGTRSEQKALQAREIGAHETLLHGAHFDRPVDVVIDSVGQATWKSSVAALGPGGRLVVCGATSGFSATTNLARIFSQQLHVMGSTMGTLGELQQLVSFLETTGVRPVIDSARPLAAAAEQFRRLIAGEAFGKLVLTP